MIRFIKTSSAPGDAKDAPGAGSHDVPIGATIFGPVAERDRSTNHLQARDTAPRRIGGAALGELHSDGAAAARVDTVPSRDGPVPDRSRRSVERPRLAGRSAIYIFRQLYDIQHGMRKGNAVALMQPVVVKLSQDDMLSLAAYMASRMP